jgi:hypothetical protein
MRKVHAQRLVAEGIVRIGTLYEYRDIESHGVIIGDDAEGSKSAVMHAPYLEIKKQEDVPEFVRNRIIVGENSTVRMINSKFIVSEESPNYYVFSLAAEYSPALMKEFGYDACVRIDQQGFFSTLNRCFRHHGNFAGLFPCVYMPREVHHTEQHSIHPALIKGLSYANQKEERGIWEPTGKNIRPVILKCRKLSRWCSQIA